MPATLRRPDVPDTGPFHDFLSYWVWRHSDSESLTPEHIQEVRRHYYGDVTAIDRAVGKIRAALERTGQAENTWIIYTSDHGEMMGEHSMLMKMVFYEPSVRVPLVIRPPAGTEPQVVEDLVEQIDIPATIRHLAGAGDGDSLAGRSLLDDAGSYASHDREAVFSENYGFGMVRTERYKLVFEEDSQTPGQLFDLVDDPNEDVNLAADPDAVPLVDDLMDEHARPFLAGGRTKLGVGRFESLRSAG